MDFLSLGELLIDFTPAQGEIGAPPLFQMNPGGAPANVACVLAQLGHSTGFAGKVGQDLAGDTCVRALQDCGVDTRFIARSDTHPTTLAFVCLDSTGNRSFSFYRTGTADVSLSADDLRDIPFEQTRIFHFGAVSLTTQPARDTTLLAVTRAKEAGCIVTFDPNLRLPLWQSAEEARTVILRAAPCADILKISAEEGEFLFGVSDPLQICRAAQERLGVAAVLVTLGPDGCTLAVGPQIHHSAAYQVETVDTTGAGDAFLGGVLHCLLQLKKLPHELNDGELMHMLDFGNATGSLVTAKKGAIPAIPTLEEIDHCMRSVPRLKRTGENHG